MHQHTPRLTYAVDLPGGQDRLRQMILYVSKRCASARHFGLVKLNKIIWRADFEAFATRGVPVTGRPYQRLQFGPAAKEMLPIHSEMLRDGLIAVELRDFGDNMVERRTIALHDAALRNFNAEDLSFVDGSVRHYWDKTGTEASDESHGVAWSTRHDRDPMPYESAYLSDEEIGWPQKLRLATMMYERGWTTE
jgi:hypothetical protein